MINNKEEKPLEHYMKNYRACTPEAIIRRCGLNGDGDTFRLTYMGAEYTITHPEFRTELKGSSVFDPLLYNDARILLLHFLTEGVHTVPAGQYLTYREMPWGTVYEKNFRGRCLLRLAHMFGNRLERFARACEKLGGRKMKDGDLSYEVSFLNDFSVKLILWCGDDEFPPASQILFSDNFPLAFTAEDMAVAGDIIINGLKCQDV